VVTGTNRIGFVLLGGKWNLICGAERPYLLFMKFSLVALLCAGMIFNAFAQDTETMAWQNRQWTGNVTLEKGVYESTDNRMAYVWALAGTTIKIAPGCVLNRVRICGRESVTWDVQGSLFTDANLGAGQNDRFVAKDTLFQSVTMVPSSVQFLKDLWTAEWNFENCILAGRFMAKTCATKHHSIRATRCTFYDIDLPKVIYTQDPSKEAQAPEFQFKGCRFVRCEVPESFLAATVDCVFEDCRFPTQREDWSRATKPITVTATSTGRTTAPSSYANGNLKITFKILQVPPSGATLPHDYPDRRLSLPGVTSFGAARVLGTVRNTPLSATASNPTMPPAESTTPPPAPAVISPESQERTAEMVKTHRNNLVFVSGSDGAGSGFLAQFGPKVYLVTNAHVAAGVKGAGFQTLQGEKVQVGAASVAVGHDLFLMQSTGTQPMAIMTGVDQNASIGDEIVVLGNSEGAGVINTIMGKIVGVGPQLVEVDAPFQPGNSGSPIIHLKSGKVIGAATYLTYRKYDAATKQPVKDPVVRRFGYRLDSVKTWQPVQWPALFAQAKEMESIETLTEDLTRFLQDLSDGKVSSSAHSNPAIRTRIDAWLTSKSRGLSVRDRQGADQSFISFLKITCQSDIAAVRPKLTYDYFQRELVEQEKSRVQMAEIFDKIIKDLQSVR
jgi:hypothetical protein